MLGALWLLFVTRELGLSPAVVGLIACVGGLASLAGATSVDRATARLGPGRLALTAFAVDAAATVITPLAPGGAPLVAIAMLVGAQLVGAQLVGDSVATMFEITEVSIRQARVRDVGLGRVNATILSGSLATELFGAIAGGLVAETIGLRAAVFLPVIAGVVGTWALARSAVPALKLDYGNPALEPDEAHLPDEPNEAHLPDEPNEAHLPDEPNEAHQPDEPNEAHQPDEPNEAHQPDAPDGLALPDAPDGLAQPEGPAAG